MVEKEEDSQLYKIMLVDDSKVILNSLKELIKEDDRFDCEIETSTDAETTIKMIKEERFDLILSDYYMPRMNGVKLLKKVKEESPETIRILLTGSSDMEILKEALSKADLHSYLQKPWDEDELLVRVHEALIRKDQREEEDMEKAEDVKKALDRLDEFQQRLSEEGSGDVSSKEIQVFEFPTEEEFNTFSFELRNKENVDINDVHIFEDKYIIKVEVEPSYFEKIK